MTNNRAIVQERLFSGTLMSVCAPSTATLETRCVPQASEKDFFLQVLEDLR